METEIKNKETGLTFSTRNIKPGAYKVVNGKLVPDENDEAMRIRHNLKKKTDKSEKKIKEK